MIPVESILKSLHWSLKQGLMMEADLSSEKIFLVSNISHKDDDMPGVDKGACYRYVTYFKLIGNT